MAGNFLEPETLGSPDRTDERTGDCGDDSLGFCGCGVSGREAEGELPCWFGAETPAAAAGFGSDPSCASTETVPPEKAVTNRANPSTFTINPLFKI